MRTSASSRRALRRGVLPGVVSALATLPSSLAAQTSPVYPGDPRWTPVVQGEASAAITGAQPRLGNGSLELHLAGNDTDWSYYLSSAGARETASFGRLDALDRLGFDWMRGSAGAATGDAPWLAQSPVLRLLVREDRPAAEGGTQFSELVWERYYNAGAPTPLDQWQSEELTSQRFWRVSFDGLQRSYTRASCADGPIDPLFPLLTLSPVDWAAGGGCYDPANTFVWGISVGLGSNWPHQYVGFADNVQLGFAGQGGAQVGANFELRDAVVSPVPEPSVLGLLGVGLLALGAGRATTRRRGTTRGTTRGTSRVARS